MSGSGIWLEPTNRLIYPLPECLKSITGRVQGYPCQEGGAILFDKWSYRWDLEQKSLPSPVSNINKRAPQKITKKPTHEWQNQLDSALLDEFVRHFAVLHEAYFADPINVQQTGDALTLRCRAQFEACLTSFRWRICWFRSRLRLGGRSRGNRICQ